MALSICASVGLGVFLQQRGGLHDLAALAVAALGDVVFLPGDLARMRAGGAEAFDGGDLLAGGRA